MIPTGTTRRTSSPWWTDGNQRKSISNDRLLLSTQLILLVIAVDLIEWLHTLQTHTHPSTLNPVTLSWIRSADLPQIGSTVILLRQAVISETIRRVEREKSVNLLNPFLVVQLRLDCRNVFICAEDVGWRHILSLWSLDKGSLSDVQINTTHGSVWEAAERWTSFDKGNLSTCCIHIKVT